MSERWPTKGSIETFDGEGPKIKVEFCFNPKEYSISKQNTWNKDAEDGKSDSMKLKFAGGNPKQMKLQLFFDTFEAGKDVRKEYTDNLFKMMEVNTDLPKDHPKDAKGQPPKCEVIWGRFFSYVCYIESLSVQYTLFLEDGTPVRATCDLQLKQAIDERQQAKTNPSSGGEGGERTWTVQPVDRLDLIAYREYGDPRLWRVIARANGLANPHAIRPGQRLVIPGSPS
jgi:hypothetical protein